MTIGDGIIPSLHTQAVRYTKHIGIGMPFRRNKLEASHFEQLPVGVTKVDRIHKTTIDGTGILDAKLLKPGRDLSIGGAGNRESNVVQVADILWIRCRVIDARRTDKESDQPPITRIKIEVEFIRHVEVGLLENKRHAQNTLIEIDDRLTVGTNKCDVMNALCLDFGHNHFSEYSCRCEKGVFPDEAISWLM